MVHSHSHYHAPQTYTRAFQIGIGLNVGFVLIEAATGLITHSLALLADAGHNLSDVLGLGLAWGASYLSQRPPSQMFTYGLRRSSILASLLNALLLMVAMGAIAWEALQQLQNPSEIAGSVLIGVATIGVVINGITAWLFLGGRSYDLNIRAAFWHMAADALVSLGVVLAGVSILFTGWFWFDPAVSLVIVAVVVIGTWDLLKDSLKLSLDAVPAKIDPRAVHLFLAERPGVACLHDLHIWAMSTTETALTAHLVMPDGHPGDDFLRQVADELHHHFGIDHTTLQIEIDNGAYPCQLEPNSRV
jgi:cobalt-zinc-cadmium efflux system protein